MTKGISGLPGSEHSIFDGKVKERKLTEPPSL